MRRTLVILATWTVLALPALADSPETGVITGTVTASGEAVPGVTVKLESSTGERDAVTDARGVYRFALLRPATYTVSAALEGFGTSQREISVEAGSTHEVDIAMRLETAETIEVISESPVIDKFEVSAGATIKSEIAEAVTSRNSNYYGALQALPGVTGDGRQNGQERPSVNGARWQEGSVFVDGVDATFARYGASRIFLPSVATTEVSLSSAGAGSEYGRYTGGYTNVITKSGTNVFHGELALLAQDADLNENYDFMPELAQRATCLDGSVPISCDPGFLRYSDEELNADKSNVQAALGGPIKRDKAWFFVSFAQTKELDTETTSTGDVIDGGEIVDAYVGKINWQPGVDHSLAVSYIATPLEDTFLLPNAGDRYVPTRRDFGGDLASVSWNYQASQDMFLEAKIARQESEEDKYLNAGDGRSLESAIAEKQNDPRYPPNPAAGPHWPGNNFNNYTENTTFEQFNGWLLDNGVGTNSFPRDQANAKLTWFAGTRHELGFGVDYQEVKWDQDLIHNDWYGGPVFDPLSPSGYEDCGQLRGLICIYRDVSPPDLEGVVQSERGTISENMALFARDRFTVGDHWAFNLGLRLENQNHENDVGREVIDSTDIAPRLSASYDIKADGQMLINASIGRTYQQIGQDLTNNYLIEEWNGTNAYDRYSYCDAFDNRILNPFVTSRPCRGVGYTRIFASLRPGVYWDLVDQGVFDSDIEPYYKDEVTAGFEWNFTNAWTIDTKLIYSEVQDYIGSTEQQAPDGNYFILTENIEDYPTILRQLGVLDEETIANFRQPEREYAAIQLQLNRRFKDGWALYNNLTLQDSEGDIYGDLFFNTGDDYGRNLENVLTEGHIDTCITNYTEFNDPVRTEQFCRDSLTPHLGEPLSTINRYGRFPYDHVATWKSYGFKVWNFGQHAVNLGGLLTWESGRPWERDITLAFAGTDDGSPAQNNFSTSINTFLEPRGSNTMSAIYTVDLFSSWDFPLTSRLQGSVRFEILNATNQQKPRSLSSTGEVNTFRFGWQTPRRYEASVSIEF